MLDSIHYRYVLIRDAFRLWVMWTLTGWPFKRRCPECAGSGTYATETMARYGDDPHECAMCCGTGKVRR